MVQGKLQWKTNRKSCMVYHIKENKNVSLSKPSIHNQVYSPRI